MKKTKKTATASAKPAQEVHWDFYRDGVTQSLISKFLICRHRFWIRTVLGLSQSEGFNHRIEHGNMMHAGFEAFAQAKNERSFKFPIALQAGLDGIARYGKWLRKEYPQADSIKFWEDLCFGQFEIYCKHWRKVDEKRQYIFQEQIFEAHIKLPSGRIVKLKGKLDEGFRDKNNRNILQENKCKGDIDEEGISSSLHHDLQTMIYLSAANRLAMFGKDHTCNDILYNVIRRPNGGRFPLRQKKTETVADFTSRILDGIKTEPNKHFMRWSVNLHRDLDLFENRTLFPILEQMADWWDSIKDNPLDPWTARYSDNHLRGAGPGHPTTLPNHLHFCRPFGIFDSLALGNRGDYFDYLMSGGKNKVGLTPRALFTELTNASLSEK